MPNKISQYQLIFKLLLSIFLVVVLLQYSNRLHAAPKLVKNQATNNGNTLDKMSKHDVSKSVKETLELLNKVYVYPKKAKQISHRILQNLTSGKYDQITNKVDFANIISQDLRELSSDGHLSIQIAETSNQKPTHILPASVGKQKNNFAFERVEVLEGNIGYLKFNKFNHLEEAKMVASSALHFLQTTDALIIDLRENIGGSPKLVQYILSHFYQGKTKLWEMLDRNAEIVERTDTNPELTVENFSNNFPLYILTSSKTYSSAEFFAYTLKNSGKAKIIGEYSGGGAHAVRSSKINDLFHGRFSQERPINPNSQTDWEGVGIEPDIKVSPAIALDTAYIDALQTLATSHPKMADFYQWNIEILKPRVEPVTISDEVLQSYSGLYGKERELTYSNGELYYNRKGNKKIKLLPLAQDLFMLPNASYFRIKIVIEKNKVIAINGIYDDGESIEYMRAG